MNRSFLMTAGVALLVLGGAAQAQVVITSGPSTGAAGASGLTGQFYFTDGAPITTIGTAQAYIDGNSETGTFTASEAGITGSANGFGYSASDNGSAIDFLQPGDDGKSYVGATTTLGDGIFDFQGYLNVTAPGTLQFSTYSDDGSAIFIAGQEVVNNDGTHAEMLANGSATFTQAGLYPVDLIYFNHVVPTSSGSGGLQANFGGVHLSQIAPAPELSGSTGLLMGMFGLGMLGRRARRRVVSRQS